MGKTQPVPLSFLHKSLALDSYLGHSNRSGSPDNDTKHQPTILNHEIMKELLIFRICCLNNKWCVKKTHVFHSASKIPVKKTSWTAFQVFFETTTQSFPCHFWGVGNLHRFQFSKKSNHLISIRVDARELVFITVCPNFWLKKLKKLANKWTNGNQMNVYLIHLKAKQKSNENVSFPIFFEVAISVFPMLSAKTSTMRSKKLHVHLVNGRF